jgi:hypothetical protein
MTSTTITYETIIAQLMPKQNVFSLQPNIIMKASDFPVFKDIFDDVFYRIGITNMYMGKNISLQNSIMYCVDSQYNNKDIESIINTINNISDDIEKIVKELQINIFIFDFKNNIIECIYNGDYMNPWRPSIYLARYDEWWEPIIVKDLRIFSFSSPRANVLKHNILNMEVYKYNTKDNITINDNFNEIITLDGFMKNANAHNNTDSEELFIAPVIPTRGKLDKMKKDDLIALCNTLNKIINISKPTKKDLIDIITN